MNYEDVAKEYDKTFYPNSKMVFGVPDGEPIVIHIGASGQILNSYRMSYDADESSEEMMDRIRRSVASGKNLFFEEWKELEPYEDGCI